MLFLRTGRSWPKTAEAFAEETQESVNGPLLTMFLHTGRSLPKRNKSVNSQFAFLRTGRSWPKTAEAFAEEKRKRPRLPLGVFTVAHIYIYIYI